MCIKYTTFLEIFISKIFVVSVVLNCIVVVHSAWITPRILELARFIPDFDLPEFSLPSFPNSLNKNRVVSGTVSWYVHVMEKFPSINKFRLILKIRNKIIFSDTV